VALETEEAMSILKTELKKDERARDLKAIVNATFFLSTRCTGSVHQTAEAPSPESRTRRPALAWGRVPGHSPDGKPTYGELMLAVQPVARLASVLQVRRISSPKTLAVWARNN
jgi:hypothetical protein